MLRRHKDMANSPDQDLITSPRWRPENLGDPLPESPHATSVCLPEWQDVIDYEEKRPRVLQRLRAGYPRFVVPEQCMRFFEHCREMFARDRELCHAYPSERAARRCAACIARWSGVEARIVPWPEKNVFVVCFPDSAESSALKYWRHTGDGISSRRAESLLAGQPDVRAEDARMHIRERIAGLAGVPKDCVYLFKSGMSALYTLHRMAVRMHPDGCCVQFGFPYVDTLKIQQDFGMRSAFFPLGNAVELKMLGHMSATDRIAGVFCEFPSNPLLNSPDLKELHRIGTQHRFPVIVDDTVASWANVDLLPAADVIVTSLTKYFNGRGDLMAGAAVLNPRSPLYQEMGAAMKEEYEDTTWGVSMMLLDQHSLDFTERIARINRTAEEVCDWLVHRPEVEKVFYPKYQTPALYNAFRRPGGGYGGLFSLLLKDAARSSAPFYNRLEISKGPNLGTTFSLCCPFTLLAHYDELDEVERHGVSRHLLRFSIGLEDPDELIRRMERALGAANNLA